MPVQLIEQVLSPDRAPYINGTQAELRFSAATLKNMYQGLVEKDGLGITDKFTSANDAEQAVQVKVTRVKPVKMKPREQGASKNGASFSANQHYTQTETVGIDILTVLDDPIILPRFTTDHIRVDLLAEQIEIFSGRLNTILNGATYATKLHKVFTEDAKGNDVNITYVTDADITNKTVLQRFEEANSLLDEGDESHGIDIFPLKTRVAVLKVSYRSTLKSGGILTLGGANYAYDIAKGNGLNNGTSARTDEDGYIGDIDGVPVHLISNESLAHASDFLGLPNKEFKKNGAVIGYISSSYANARGVSTSERTKVVPATAGQGVILQPYVCFGVASWYALGTSLLESAEYNPIKGLKAIFNGEDIDFVVKAGGSRLYPTTGVYSAKSTTGFTLISSTALDDFDVDHVVGACYVVADKEIETVQEFLTAYNAEGAVKGTFSIGSAVTFSSAQTAGKVINTLIISDDGSVTLSPATI
jgi:hypothetical protein